MQQARDGSVMWWDTADAPGPPRIAPPGKPAPVTVAVTPVRPGHGITLDYRVNGGPIHQATATPEPRARHTNVRLFRATLPGQPGGVVEFLPVLRLVGQAISPRLAESAEGMRYQVDAAPAPVQALPGRSAQTGTHAGAPRWAWHSTFLGALSVTLRKEVVGPTPDGLRIDWHVMDGRFVGPGLAAVVLPGGADWMRIRQDGVGVVNVTACLETQQRVRIFANYTGFLDFGPDGYERALRDEFDPCPPLVVTPTYATADRALAWLNRAQCIGVGRVDMRILRVEFDAYVLSVDGRMRETKS